MLDLSDRSLNSLVIDLKKLHDSVLWMRFNCLKATEPLRGDSLLFDQEDYWNIQHFTKKDFQIDLYFVDSAFASFPGQIRFLVNQILVLG